MEIKKDEIKSIVNIGRLFNSEVKLYILKGGFHIGMGKRERNSNATDILAVGSHPAIIIHQIEKKFPKDFEQKMAKSEKDSLPNLTSFSHNLSSAEKNILNLDIYALKKNETVEFRVTKHNFDVFTIKAKEIGDSIVLEKTEKDESKMTKLDKKSLSRNLLKSIREYANNNNLKVKKKF